MATCNPPPRCSDFSGPSSGKPPINVIRSGKDAMPFREGVVVTTYMNDYIPPVLLSGFSGQGPTVTHTGNGNTSCGATKKSFLDYRHEILTNSAGPKFVFGRLPSQYTPWPDVTMASKVIPWIKLEDSPNIRPSNVDRKRDAEIKKFYSNCQEHRDYYLDRTESSYPVPYFNLGHPYPVRCPVDERTFKIRRPQDAYDVPRYLGPELYCQGMPCIQHQELLTPFTNIPKLPREPFLCDRVKPKDTTVDEVLLV